MTTSVHQCSSEIFTIVVAPNENNIFAPGLDSKVTIQRYDLMFFMGIHERCVMSLFVIYLIAEMASTSICEASFNFDGNFLAVVLNNFHTFIYDIDVYVSFLNFHILFFMCV